METGGRRRLEERAPARSPEQERERAASGERGKSQRRTPLLTAGSPTDVRRLLGEKFQQALLHGGRHLPTEPDITDAKGEKARKEKKAPHTAGESRETRQERGVCVCVRACVIVM